MSMLKPYEHCMLMGYWHVAISLLHDMCKLTMSVHLARFGAQVNGILRETHAASTRFQTKLDVDIRPGQWARGTARAVPCQHDCRLGP